MEAKTPNVIKVLCGEQFPSKWRAFCIPWIKEISIHGILLSEGEKFTFKSGLRFSEILRVEADKTISIYSFDEQFQLEVSINDINELCGIYGHIGTMIHLRGGAKILVDGELATVSDDCFMTKESVPALVQKMIGK